MTHAEYEKEKIKQAAREGEAVVANGAAATEQINLARVYLINAKQHLENSRVHALQEIQGLLDMDVPLNGLFEATLSEDARGIIQRIATTRQRVERYSNDVSVLIKHMEDMIRLAGMYKEKQLDDSGKEFRQAMEDLLALYNNL